MLFANIRTVSGSYKTFNYYTNYAFEKRMTQRLIHIVGKMKIFFVSAYWRNAAKWNMNIHSYFNKLVSWQCCHPHPRSQSGGQWAVSSSTSWGVGTPSPGGPADLESVRSCSGRPFCISRNRPIAIGSIPYPRQRSAWINWHTTGPRTCANMHYPQWACQHRHCARSGRTRSGSC